jgi:hypothetical protein
VGEEELLFLFPATHDLDQRLQIRSIFLLVLAAFTRLDGRKLRTINAHTSDEEINRANQKKRRGERRHLT